MPDQPYDAVSRDDRDRDWPVIPFDVGMVLVALVLCLLYALLFSRMVYDSVVEHVVTPTFLPRYMGPPHTHHPLEWAWLLAGFAGGWLGTLLSARHLVRRWIWR